ncbi:hypothetical protein HBA_0619 [Sodalis endosymbiont of Henestaris halophilus]|nr:hypothetical protein HBA_0619 [Sodalis endosymbiont of Henestaris halophilus]
MLHFCVNSILNHSTKMVFITAYYLLIKKILCKTNRFCVQTDSISLKAYSNSKYKLSLCAASICAGDNYY